MPEFVELFLFLFCRVVLIRAEMSDHLNENNSGLLTVKRKTCLPELGGNFTLENV